MNIKVYDENGKAHIRTPYGTISSKWFFSDKMRQNCYHVRHNMRF